MIYYISDTHFYHARIEEVDHRGFTGLTQMHEYMIERWNSRVRDEDDVYVLGDISWGDGIKTWELLSKLRGRITLIEGNHDAWFLDDPEFVDTFEDVRSYMEIQDQGRDVILSHYPIPFYNKQFRDDRKTGERKTFMLYGHVHNTFDEYLLYRFIKDASSHPRIDPVGEIEYTPFQMLNTFCGFADYVPQTLDEWIENDKKRKELIAKLEEECGGTITAEQWEAYNKDFLELGRNK